MNSMTTCALNILELVQNLNLMSKVTFLMTNLKVKSSFNSFIFVTFIFLLPAYLYPTKSKDFILCEQDQYVVVTSSCRNTFIQIHMLLYYSSGAHKTEKTLVFCSSGNKNMFCCVFWQLIEGPPYVNLNSVSVRFKKNNNISLLLLMLFILASKVKQKSRVFFYPLFHRLSPMATY